MTSDERWNFLDGILQRGRGPEQGDGGWSQSVRGPWWEKVNGEMEWGSHWPMKDSELEMRQEAPWFPNWGPHAMCQEQALGEKSGSRSLAGNFLG